ncbi:MAG: hypothetical protein BWY63_03753 [Chloroflexi bacterium ADurb.Bin360]|nr:MAG: hypothetical protein BWY63_03753 [Chloroflexi bacterium ADurb.Bin360]
MVEGTDWTKIGWIILGIMALALILALTLLALTYRSLKRIQIPQDAGFFTTLRHVPLTLVIILDLLDLALDFLSAPVGWLILSYFGLERLRMLTVVESLIPGTQFIPTLTGAWLLAKAGVRLPEPTQLRRNSR